MDASELAPVTVGCDIGQLHDYTAICVCEVEQRETGKYRMGPQYHIPAHVDANGWFHKGQDAEAVMESHYTVRHIERVPLGTSYPAVAVRIADMLCSSMFHRRYVRVLIDVTGVGRPVYDDVDREIRLRKQGIWYGDGTFRTPNREEMLGLILKPITFSHGEKYNHSTGVLAKAYLVSRLQSLLQRGVVHAPETAEVKAMIEELRVYQIKVDQDGHDTYGAMGAMQHDDLATALGLACLEDPFALRVRYSQPLFSFR